MQVYNDPLSIAEMAFLLDVMYEKGISSHTSGVGTQVTTQQGTHLSGTINEPSHNSNNNVPQAKSYNYVTHEIKLSEPQSDFVFEPKDAKTSQKYSAPISIVRKAQNIVQYLDMLTIDVWGKSKDELDEDRTVDNYSTTGTLSPIFKEKKLKKSYYILNLIVDTNSSMFLWQDKIEHFKNSILLSHSFKEYNLILLDSSQVEPTLCYAHSSEEMTLAHYKFMHQETLTLILSDVIGLAWRNHALLGQFANWSQKGFFAIVSLLPEHMWRTTPLRLGVSSSASISRQLPKNADLKLNYDSIEKEGREYTKIPIIPYTTKAIEHLSRLLISNKEQWIGVRTFDTSIQTIKNVTTTSAPSTKHAKTRVEDFFATATKQARHLAIYASVLPLHTDILAHLIKAKGLDKQMDVFAEFYFGGLLAKKKEDSEYYSFHDGVRSHLMHYLTMSEAKEIFEMLDSIIRQATDSSIGMIDFLYGKVSGQVIGTHERELANLLLQVLKEIGTHYAQEYELVDKAANTIYKENHTFQMGSEENENEKPVHTVTFTNDFAIAKHPVTFEQYDLYCEDTGAKKPDDRGWGRGKRPVINVSWKDAVAYCDWLSKKSGQHYRLPSEAEWEYACRAGTKTKWSFGDDAKELGKYAWYNKNSKDKTQPVGKKEPNPWGLYDMHGNIWEWCQDSWADDYTNTPRDGTAHVNKIESSKVQRGGSWGSIDIITRSAYRVNGYDSSYGVDNVGFRLLRTLP